MPTPVKRTWKDRLMTAFKAKDEAALQEALDEAPDEAAAGAEPQTVVLRIEGAAAPEAAADEGTGAAAGAAAAPGDTQDDEPAPAWFTAYTAQADARFGKIEEALGKLAGGTADEAAEEDENGGQATGDEGGEGDPDGQPTGDADGEEGEGEGQGKTQDSASLAAAFQDVVARAEILAPGIKLPTYDSKATRKVTRDRMCALRRRALVAASTGDHAAIVKSVTGGAKLDKLTCDAVTPFFLAASSLAKDANAPRAVFVRDSAPKEGPPKLADINSRNREFWKGQ